MNRIAAAYFALAMLFPAFTGSAQSKMPYNQMPVRYYLTGTVLSRADLAPARSVWIYLYEGRALRTKTLTGDDGRFYIGKLEQKTYAVVVKQRRKRDYRFGNVTLPKDQNIEIVLPR